jgi:predicted ATPase/class 3 adenylate cyclase
VVRRHWRSGGPVEPAHDSGVRNRLFHCHRSDGEVIAVPTRRVDSGSDSVALLFTDIEGSTRLLERLGAVTYADVLAHHHKLIRDAIAAVDGEEMGSEGDSFFVIFERASDAISAAVAAQRSLADASWPERADVKVRMGIHLGRVSRAAGNVVGMAIHTAARIMSTAHGGQIVVSDTCAADARSTFAMRDLGRHRLKDIEGAVHLFQVDVDGAPVEFPPLRSLPSGMTPVPGYLTELVGREKERLQLEDLLAKNRMVTITGPPGVGKTRLAAAVAGRVSDVAFADLTPLADGDEIATRVAVALAVPIGPNETSTDALLRGAADASTLVVLDNCEHVADDLAAFIARVLSQCRHLRALATSREPLAIEGETVFPLEPLDNAAELFVSRARAAHPVLQLSAGDPDVVAICDSLDRLPLAVELAASLVPTMTPAEIRSRLDDRFAVLQSGRRDAPSRHRTLQAAVGWSYQLLRHEEQSCLRRLSVMRGPFDLEAAEAVGQASVAVLARLQCRSLISAIADRETGSFRLLETIRAYAADLLAASGEEAAARATHAATFTARAASIMQRGRPDQIEKLDADHDNYMAALAWLHDVDPAAGLRLALHVEGLFSLRLDATESTELLESLLARAGDATDSVRGGALGLLADIYRNSGKFADARRCAEQAHVLGGVLPLVARGSPSVILGQVLAMQGDLDRATALFEERLTVARARGTPDDEEELAVLRELANLAIERNDPDAALPLLEEAMMLAAQAEGPWLRGILPIDRGRVAIAQGDLAMARPLFEDALARCQRFGIVRGIALTTLELARVARLENSFDEAGDLLDEATRVYRTVGDAGGLAHAIVERGLLASALGEHADAARILGAADAVREGLGIVTPGREAPWIDEARAAAAASLGPAEVERLTAEGRVVDLDVLLGDA